MMLGTVAALRRYPVKSMLGEGVDAVDVALTGMAGDRRLAGVSRTTGKVASAKLPRLWRDLLTLSAATCDAAAAGAVRITLPEGKTVWSSDAGVDAIYCSTHGGRQANGGLAAIELLPGVVQAAGDAPVIFDSGVRGGEHIVKALALGARAVAIGRPYVYGLALGGEDGVVHVLRSLLAEADLLMAIDGYAAVGELTPEALVDRHA